MDAKSDCGMLIAETDEEGFVTCVWVKPEGTRVPRPYSSTEFVSGIETGQFQVSGAQADAVDAWLHAQP